MERLQNQHIISSENRKLPSPNSAHFPEGVSLLIVCYNESENIDALLKALLAQSWKSSISEILIADNGSSDGTYEKLKAKASDLPIPMTVWQRAENNIGAARDELVKRAISDWVVFVDADCVPPPDWLKDILEKLQACRKLDKHFAGCGGGHHLPGRNSMQKAINGLMRHTPLHAFSSQSYDGEDVGRCVDHLPTTNAVFCKKAVQNVGGFSKKFSRVGEDLDLGLRLNESGFNLYRFAKPSLQNDCAQTPLGWAKRMFLFGTAQGLVFGRRGGFTWLFLMASLLISAFGLLVPPIFVAASLVLLAVSWLFASRVARRESSPDLWGQAFQVTALTAPSYFLGFLNGLIKKLRA
ncbi:MAG: glycosyltransferase [Pseudomonadota bacterium]